MEILIQDIQQGNGFRVRVNINQEGPDDNQLHACCTFRWSVRNKRASDYAFAYTIISLWEGARA